VAIEVGVVLSSLLFMERMSKLSTVISAEQETDALESYANVPKGIEIFEISGPFFLPQSAIRRNTERYPHTSKVVIIRMRHVPFIDSTGIRNLKGTIKDLKARKVRVVLSGVRPEVRTELEKGGIAQLLGEGNIADNFDQALVMAEHHLRERELHAHHTA
jgi:SulP family sulfate permease